MTLLSLANLTRAFDPDAAPAVDGLTLEVRGDEVFTLVGPSGCGKTTALRMIAGLELPDGGTIRLEETVLDAPCRHLPPERRPIGLVFQELALFPHLDVLRNVAFGLHHLPRKRRRDRAMEVLGWVGLADLAHRRPHELSGGQQQRVALARSLAPAPRLILLDEPFNSLDAALREGVRRQVLSVLKEHRMSALLVTHDQEEALSFADRIGVMNEGRLLQVGTPGEVYHQPATAFVARFLGQTNLLDGEAAGETADSPLGRLRINRSASGRVLLSVRPEHLRLQPPGENGAPVGQVTARQFKGHDLTLHVDCGERRYIVQAGYDCPWRVGQAVGLGQREPAAVVAPDLGQ